MREIVGRPLSFDRSATIIGRLGHHVETRNRKPAGTSMATCVLPICSARQRETSAILFFFFFFQRTFVLHRYALSYPRIREFHERLNILLPHHPFRRPRSGHPRQYLAEFTAVLLHRFIAARNVLLPRDFQVLFRIRLGKLHEIPSDEERFANRSYKERIQYRLKVHATEREAYVGTDTIDRIIRATRNCNPQTFYWREIASETIISRSWEFLAYWVINNLKIEATEAKSANNFIRYFSLYP